MFSIMILAHGRLQQLADCLASLEATIASGDTELLVLDNGSPDWETKEFIAGLPQVFRTGNVRVFRSETNLGVAGGRAYLLALAQGDTLVFLDSDTVVQDDRWLDIIATWLEAENVGLVGPAGSYIPEDWGGFYPATVGECDVVSGWCQAFKREVVDAGAALDKDYGLFYEEDSDFCLQIRELGWDIYNTGFIGVTHTPSNSGAHLANREATMARFCSKWQGAGLTKAEGAY